MTSDDESVLTQTIRSELDARPTGTASALSRALGVTAQTVSKWRKGEIVPEPARFPALDEFFELPPGTFRSLAGLAPEGDVPLMERVSALEAGLAEVRSLLESLVDDRRTDRERP